jgi:hypothetical protein
MDTIWGDGGNDRIDGGDEADQVHGGDGDDIITDHGTVAGGADFLRGDEGNDVISGGAGNDVLFGGGGKDFIVTGNDFTEVFAGPRRRLHPGRQRPRRPDGQRGQRLDRGRRRLRRPVGRELAAVLQQHHRRPRRAERQRQRHRLRRRVGRRHHDPGPGIQRSNGMFGFDWASHKGDPVGANSDLGIPIFGAQEPFTLRDRFDSVEGLSGWVHNDVLTGASALRVRLAVRAPGPGNPPGREQPEGPERQPDRWLRQLLGMTRRRSRAGNNANPLDDDIIDITTGAEVIIGGAGSDTIKGNLGNDFLDGDAWLNTRIRVTNDNPWRREHGGQRDVHRRQPDAADGPDGERRHQSRPAAHRARDPLLGSGRSTIPVAPGATPAKAIDTAVYNGVRADYTVTRNANGTMTVAHTNVAGVLDDGTDTIRNFEQLQFADQTLNIGNSAPTITNNGSAATATASVAENTVLVTTFAATDPNLPGGADFQIPGQTLTWSLTGADAARFQINTAGALSFVAAPNFEALRTWAPTTSTTWS